MILLDKAIVENINRESRQYLIDKVYNKYIEEKNKKKENNIDNKYEDEELDEFKRFFGKDKDEIKEFLRVLITEPFDIIFDTYPIVKRYFDIIEFFRYIPIKKSDFTVEFNANTTEGKEIREEIWKNEIEEFLNHADFKEISQKNNIYNYINYNNPYSTYENFETLLQMIKNEFELEFKTIENFKNIFIYDLGEERHRILYDMGVNVCPYCNRQYISSYIDKDGSKNKTTADLDHFYPQSAYPMFTLSIYNFIPSCTICNSRFKLDKKVDLIYPYDKVQLNKIKFNIKHMDTDSVLGDSYNFEIKIDINESDVGLKDRIRRHIELFKLEEIYESHRPFVKELIWKDYIYSSAIYEGYFDEILEKLRVNEGLDIDNNTIKYGFSLTEKDDLEKPLSKLARDVLVNI